MEGLEDETLLIFWLIKESGGNLVDINEFIKIYKLEIEDAVTWMR